MIKNEKYWSEDDWNETFLVILKDCEYQVQNQLNNWRSVWGLQTMHIWASLHIPLKASLKLLLGEFVLESLPSLLSLQKNLLFYKWITSESFTSLWDFWPKGWQKGPILFLYWIFFDEIQGSSKGFEQNLFSSNFSSFSWFFVNEIFHSFWQFETFRNVGIYDIWMLQE